MCNYCFGLTLQLTFFGCSLFGFGSLKIYILPLTNIKKAPQGKNNFTECFIQKILRVKAWMSKVERSASRSCKMEMLN